MCCYCRPQGNDLVNITECDLRVTLGPFSNGPARLATQLLIPLPGFEIIQGLQPFLRLSTLISSSKVFLVDDLVVVFTGFSNGQIRKVRIIEMHTQVFSVGVCVYVLACGTNYVFFFFFLHRQFLVYTVHIVSYAPPPHVFPSMPPGASQP